MQAEAERLADERAATYKRVAIANTVREHREKFDAEALAKEDRWGAISFSRCRPLTPLPTGKLRRTR